MIGITKPVSRLRSRQKFMQKRIPTILGLVVLVVAMVAGVLLFGQGTGVFAPRATPQTTPKKIKITNVTDSSFTVSFITDQSVTSFLKYGESKNTLDNQAGDDRDQISGSVQAYNTHHLTVRGLEPSKSYFFILGTGNGTTFTNEGEPFSVKTATRVGTQPPAKTIYGSATTESGAPADGAILYVKHSDAGELSSLVKSSGSWAIPLSNARTADGIAYATIGESDPLIVQVQGPLVSQVGQLTTTVSNSQPVAAVAYGQAGTGNSAVVTPVTELVATEVSETEATPAIDATMSATTTETSQEAAQSASAETLIDDELTAASTSATSATPELPKATVPTKTVLDVEVAKTTPQTVSSQPKITGKVKPNVVISIEVHSDTQISQQVTAGEDGSFELDIAALSQNLEPGEHTVTYSYTDPDTGQVVTETVTFTVADTSTQIAQANQPYGSGNPYPIASPSPSPSPTPSPSPSPSPTASASASPSPTASASAVATTSARVALPATDSAIPVSGSVGTTLVLVFGGLFFIISGVWSFWISSQLQRGKLEL